MLRRLPVNPSFDHLKHQAKNLLRELRAGKQEALDRAAGHPPQRKQGEPPKLADAQFVIAREYGSGSWSKLKRRIEELVEKRKWEKRDAAEADRWEVQIASAMLSGAMETPIPRFSLRRKGASLWREDVDGDSQDVTEWLRGCPGGERFTEWKSPFPVDAVRERFLVMSDLTDPPAAAGTIQIACHHRFPHTDWTISVEHDGPDKLDFSLSLDRVDTTMPISP